MSHLLPRLNFQCKFECLTISTGVKRINIHCRFCTPVVRGMEVDFKVALATKQVYAYWEVWE